MRFFITCFLLLGLVSCKSEDSMKPRNFSTVEIETLMQDSLLNVRALEINYKGEGIFTTSNGQMGLIFEESDWRERPDEKVHAIISESLDLKYDTIVPNFRALGNSKNNVFLMSIGNPALLYKITSEEQVSLVYKENHEKAFYDSMTFWNDKEGIAIGDPTDDCMSIIITRDGGNSWRKISCDDLPKAKEGEAAFAASDSNIAIVGNHTWLATGGKSSRVMYSLDKGKTWTVYDTPIIQGTETTGMYSIDFYDEQNGFAIGGDYTKPNDTLNNKIRTIDGGKTWQVVANGKGPGYRSCVQYVPKSNGKELVAVGFKGIDYSNDSGDSWKHLSDEGFYTIRFLNDSIAYAAGKGRISKLIFSK